MLGSEPQSLRSIIVHSVIRIRAFSDVLFVPLLRFVSGVSLLSSTSALTSESLSASFARSTSTLSHSWDELSVCTQLCVSGQSQWLIPWSHARHPCTHFRVSCFTEDIAEFSCVRVSVGCWTILQRAFVTHTPMLHQGDGVGIMMSVTMRP